MSDVKNIIERLVEEAIEKQIDKVLPNVIEKYLRKRFREQPNLQLSAIGWDWALALSLTDYWPDLPKKQAVKWLSDYIEIPYGSVGYDWTPGAAQDIAREYVSQFGER